MQAVDVVAASAQAAVAEVTSTPLFDELEAICSLARYDGPYTLYQVDEQQSVARPEHGQRMLGKWLDLSRVAWRHRQIWSSPLDLNDVDGRRAVTAGALLPLTAEGSVFAVLLAHADGWVHSPMVESALANFARRWFIELKQGEVAAWHQRDAARLGIIADTCPVLADPDADRQLAKLLELGLIVSGADVGLVCLADDDARPALHTAWGLQESHLEALNSALEKVGEAPLLGPEAAPVRLLLRSDLERSGLPPDLDGIDALLAARLDGTDEPLGAVVLVNPEQRDTASQALLKTVMALCATAVERSRLFAERVLREAMREQMRIAGAIQQGLLPAPCLQIGHLEVAARAKPCDEAGGDFYDYFGLEDGRFAFVLGDATGHGVGAALLAATARSALRVILQERTRVDLAAAVGSLNRLAEEDFTSGSFITLCLVVLDPVKGTLQYVNAGHDPPMLRIGELGAEVEDWPATGPPVGVLPGFAYEVCETALQPGEQLVLMSDGVHEATNCRGEWFGKRRLRAVVNVNTPDTALALRDRVIAAYERFLGGADQTDDVTVVCLRFDA